MFADGRFWEATAERAVKTAAQAFLATIAVGATAWEMDWPEVIGITLLSAIGSVATSIASSGSGDDSGPSWGGVERIDGGGSGDDL